MRRKNMIKNKALLRVENLTLASVVNGVQSTAIDRLSFNVYKSTLTAIFSKASFDFSKVFDVLVNRLKADDYLENGEINYLNWNEEVSTSQKFRDMREDLFSVDESSLSNLYIDQSIGNLLTNVYKENNIPVIYRINSFIKKDIDIYNHRKRERNQKLKKAQETYLEKEKAIDAVSDKIISSTLKRIKKYDSVDITKLQLKEIIKEAEKCRTNGIQNINKEYSTTIKAILNDWSDRQVELCYNLKTSLKRAEIDNKNYIESIRYNAKLVISNLKREKRNIDENPSKIDEINKMIKQVRLDTKMRTKVNRREVKREILLLLKKLKIDKPYEFLNKTKEGLTKMEIQKFGLAYAILAKYPIIFVDESNFQCNPNSNEYLYQIIEKLKEEYHVSFVYYTNDKNLFINVENCYRVIAYGSRTMEMGFKDFRINPPYNEYAKSIYSNEEFTYTPEELAQMNLRRVQGERFVCCTKNQYEEIEQTTTKVSLEPKIKSYKII